ncbi:unnamed protein product [Protopolystoma xenopodis]|uniref:Uncharacterized protein n=1 Tax=Protopolystoma xenopodis TaxID=117903 RepID=A0A448WT85_9PLAT|nr:unnamed protein product [Protopolystoma xenopodis]
MPFLETVSLPSEERLEAIKAKLLESNNADSVASSPSIGGRLSDDILEICSNLEKIKTERNDLQLRLEGLKFPAALSKLKFYFNLSLFMQHTFT